jgi:hypothetical protein
MTGPVKQTCGNCQHGKRNPQDVRQVICRGAPPTPMWTPQANGNMVMGAFYPTVAATDIGCAAYKGLPVFVLGGGGNGESIARAPDESPSPVPEGRLQS